jgi:hypothetical protein
MKENFGSESNLKKGVNLFNSAWKMKTTVIQLEKWFNDKSTLAFVKKCRYSSDVKSSILPYSLGFEVANLKSTGNVAATNLNVTDGLPRQIPRAQGQRGVCLQEV